MPVVRVRRPELGMLERATGLRSHLTVDQQVMAALEADDGPPGAAVVLARGTEPECALDACHAGGAIAQAQDPLPQAAAMAGAQRPPGVRADLAVHVQPVLALERAHRPPGTKVEAAVHGQPEDALHPRHRRAALAAAQEQALAVPAGVAPEMTPPHQRMPGVWADLAVDEQRM